jgi:hypothetical protein
MTVFADSKPGVHDNQNIVHVRIILETLFIPARNALKFLKTPDSVAQVDQCLAVVT